ncbi:DNA N-6-adenine-methyltransferase [Mannheimia sp. HC-2023]|uniref:DNA N-6-adenine-methyltransferase n=1 Tax=Mannheimia indoligenes TaxID=3103145 RepID=UPI002FE5CC74
MTDFDRDTWRTPKYVFRWLGIRYLFDIDGCANTENHLLPKWIGEGGFADNFLELDIELFTQNFEHSSIFINPPYSNVKPFIQQAKRLRDNGHLVVMLLNNDKSTQWYQNHIHNVANEVIDIIGGRISFIHPITGQEIKGNSKGQMVVVFDPTMEDFVQRSVSLDFIKKVGGYVC